MRSLISSFTVADFEAFKKMIESNAKEELEALGIVEQSLYHVADEDRVILVNTYNTLENAQKHKAFLESPEFQAGFAHMGVTSPITLWMAEEAWHNKL